MQREATWDDNPAEGALSAIRNGTVYNGSVFLLPSAFKRKKVIGKMPALYLSKNDRKTQKINEFAKEAFYYIINATNGSVGR
jgi:hypothetical protein